MQSVSAYANGRISFPPFFTPGLFRVPRGRVCSLLEVSRRDNVGLIAFCWYRTLRFWARGTMAASDYQASVSRCRRLADKDREVDDQPGHCWNRVEKGAFPVKWISAVGKMESNLQIHTRTSVYT